MQDTPTLNSRKRKLFILDSSTTQKVGNVLDRELTVINTLGSANNKI